MHQPDLSSFVLPTADLRAILSGSQAIPKTTVSAGGVANFEFEEDGTLRFEIKLRHLSGGLSGANFACGALRGQTGTTVLDLTLYIDGNQVNRNLV